MEKSIWRCWMFSVKYKTEYFNSLLLSLCAVQPRETVQLPEDVYHFKGKVKLYSLAPPGGSSTDYTDYFWHTIIKNSWSGGMKTYTDNTSFLITLFYSYIAI